MEVVLGMFFFIFGSVDIQFAEKELNWRTYTIKKAFPTTRQVEIIDRKEFAKATLHENVEAFVVHVSSLGSKISLHSVREAQLAFLLTKEVTVPVEYLDFADIFLEKSANVFPGRTGANEHAIELEDGKQLPSRPIYSLGPIELETLKIYIETNLAKCFIRTLKSPASVPILFVRNSDDSFRLYVNY